jgi:surfeit locus 1 family protein
MYSPFDSPATISKHEYTRVKLTGTFLHDQEIHIGPRSRGDSDVGFSVLTPLLLSNGRKILVNRGFVPKPLQNRSTRPESLVEGPVEIEGMIRGGEIDSWGLLSKVDPARGMWTWLDLKTASAWTGCEDWGLVEMVRGGVC